ncbi:LysR family transcriptional regulator [Pseudomonas gingeri]|uniref:LysR family transcriptional regulator n=1 Tax=Pseudomonas gingeri TaxID=117681 RepID=UPI0015A2A76E|nr:LysR family transcriptional regulator [Pseudomonas gingeri]NWA27772.1 LysR family transcriptional regulator [Pseudomonas gingeri]NWD69841.1 LysR family transcriptional regulator [Pseudomonas gingeri]
MNLKQIEYALAVADEGSFTRAAERCHVVQSALSHQIARLEEDLGATLFERSSRKVRLTAAGEAFVRSARPALEATRRIVAEVAAASGEVRGSLSIGKISSLTEVDLVGLLARFHGLYPQVDIHLNMSKSESLMLDVRERRLDLAFIGLWPGQKIEGLAQRLLAEEELVAVLPLGHPLTRFERLPLAELENQPLVDFQAGTAGRRQTDEAFAAAGLRHRVQFEAGNVMLVGEFVRRGLALGLVPKKIAEAFEGVMTLPVSDAPSRHLYAVWSHTPTPAAAAFLLLLEQALAQPLRLTR